MPAWWPGAKREPDVDLVVEVEAPPPVVLVVDDDADIRSWLNVALSATGWRVHEAGSGAEALEFTANQLPDVIVLDQRMPGMTGLECAAEMRSRGLELPVLLISAFLTADAVTEAERLNVLSAPKVNPALILGTVELLRGQIHTRPVIDLTTSPEPSPVHTS